MIYMDTDPALFLDPMASVCAASPYSLGELEDILFQEVLPSLRFNLFSMAGDWEGYEVGWLTKRILEKHRFGRRRPFLWRRYTKRWWARLSPMVEERR